MKYLYRNGDYHSQFHGTDEQFSKFLDGDASFSEGEAPPAQAPSTDLTASEFKRLLWLSGLDDAWDALSAHLKANDRTAYADLQGELEKSVFRLGYTLSQVEAFSPILSSQGYDVRDLTSEGITAHWTSILVERE